MEHICQHVLKPGARHVGQLILLRELMPQECFGFDEPSFLSEHVDECAPSGGLDRFRALGPCTCHIHVSGGQGEVGQPLPEFTCPLPAPEQRFRDVKGWIQSLEILRWVTCSTPCGPPDRVLGIDWLALVHPLKELPSSGCVK